MSWDIDRDYFGDSNYYICNNEKCDFILCLIDGTPKENEYYYCPKCGEKKS